MADSDVSDSNDSDQKDDPAILLQMRNQQLKNMAGGMPSIDLSSLERDSQVLVKKATKRLNRSFDGRSETIIEKFVGWHRRKKIDKIKTMLSSLFPKLKHSEDEVKSWVATVTERKEAALMVGKALLSDVEHQISLFQNHLEFLDEIINDVRQLDYDVVREISELRVALHFNQELLRKTRHSVAHVIVEEKIEKVEEKTETIGVETEKEIVGLRTEADMIDLDDGKIQCVEPDRINEKDPFFPHAEPAIWHGVKGGSTTAANVIIASSPFTRSLGSPSRPQERKSHSTSQPKDKPHRNGQSRRSKGVESPVVWDGAESKRKSLLSCSVSLKALPIGDGHDDDSSQSCRLSKASTPTMHAAGDKSFFGLFHKQLSWSPSSSVKEGENVFRSSPSNIRPDNETSKKANFSRGTARRNSVDSFKSAQRPDATPIRARADSTSSATSSEASRISTTDDHSMSSSSSAGSATASILAAKKRYKNGRMNSGLKLSSLLQILPDDELSRHVVEGVDVDQEELTNRVNKCLTLKDILKAILSTIQETQETETSSMRRMKKLRVELQTLLVDDTASVSSATSTQSLEALQSVSVRLDAHPTGTAVGSQLIYTMYAPTTERIVSMRRQSPPVMVGDDSQASVRELASDKSVSSRESSLPIMMLSSGIDEESLTVSSSSVRSVPIVVLDNNSFSLPVTASEGTHLLPVEPSLGLSTEHKRWSAETSYGSDGSHSPISTRYTAAKQNMKRMYYQHQSDGSHTALSESHDSLSIGSTSSVGVDSGFHEAATEFVDDLKAIVWEERSAKEKLAKISTLIDSASSIEGQLSATTSTR